MMPVVYLFTLGLGIYLALGDFNTYLGVAFVVLAGYIFWDINDKNENKEKNL